MPATTNVPPHVSDNDLSPADRPGGDVDLRTGWHSVLDLWWLVLLVVAATVALSLLNVSSSPTTFQGTATVYVGKPLSANGQPLGTITSESTTALEVAQGDEAVTKAADAAGTTAGKVRAGLSVQPVVSPIASKLQSPPTLLKVIVRASDRDVANKATAAIAAHLVEETNSYASEKIGALERRVEVYGTAEREQKVQRDKITRQLQGSPEGIEAAILSSLLSSLTIDQRINQSDLADAEEELAVAREIEQSKVVTDPKAVKVAGKDTRSSLVVAAFLGLALGIVAALVVGWLRRRRTATR